MYRNTFRAGPSYRFVHKEFGEDRMFNSRDMLANRQTHRQADSNSHHNTSFRYLQGRSKKLITPNIQKINATKYSHHTHARTHTHTHKRLTALCPGLPR